MGVQWRGALAARSGGGHPPGEHDGTRLLPEQHSHLAHGPSQGPEDLLQALPLLHQDWRHQGGGRRAGARGQHGLWVRRHLRRHRTQRYHGYRRRRCCIRRRRRVGHPRGECVSQKAKTDEEGASEAASHEGAEPSNARRERAAAEAKGKGGTAQDTTHSMATIHESDTMADRKTGTGKNTDQKTDKTAHQNRLGRTDVVQPERTEGRWNKRRENWQSRSQKEECCLQTLQEKEKGGERQRERHSKAPPGHRH